MVGRAAFDEESLARFWWFVCERQRIWHRRVVEGADAPWTTDTVLRDYRFTNVYRVLDPGTQYVIQAILDRDDPARDKVFNTMVYRLIGRSETHEALGFLRLNDFNPDRFERVLKHRRDHENQPVFTGAYLVSCYARMGSADKIENVTAIFDQIAATPGAIWAIVESHCMREAFYGLRSLPGFGEFLAYQVLVDLLYPLGCNDGRSLLPFSHDDWVQPGPGAKRGIAMLCHDGFEGEQPDVIEWLRAHQRAEFDRLGLSFPYLTDQDRSRIELSLADVQNCLCEFHKYEKITRGTGRARRRFRLDDARTPRELRGIYGHPSVPMP